MFVVVVFLDVVVTVPGVAAVSGLFVDVSLAVVVVLCHIDTVLSLSPFLCSPNARSLRISIVCCCYGAMLALSLLLACVVASCPLVLRDVSHHWPLGYHH